MILCVVVLPIIESGIVKLLTVIVEFSISSFNSVSFWCVYLEQLDT